ncbi:MAG: helix-turn-helix transcriptional regulator [Lachnospiraceae bacterium]|nr:helix-turn-helix transcriptional regulator [Lachnospiraceae bacterium]
MEKNRFKKLRMEKNPNEMEDFKIKDLAKEIGIAAPKISELENNRRKASLSELQAYHRYFNVPYEYLLGENDSRYYENMTLSEETGLTGKSIEYLKLLYKRFNSYSYNSSDRKTPEGTELRAINFLIEYSHALYSIGQYLDSALYDADCVQLQYVSIKYPEDKNKKNHIERIKHGLCELEHQDYDEFCEMYLNRIIKNFRYWWKILHEDYLKNSKAPNSN